MGIAEEWNEEFNPKEERKDIHRREKSKPIEYIQKTSNIIEFPNYKLVESILVKGIPKFLISDGKNIEIKNSIELENKTLKPFDKNMYMNKPYSFDSDEQVQEYIEKAKKETLDTLYRKVKRIWKKYIDADDFHIVICAADTIFTYLQDRIGLTHYLFFVGSGTSGKSTNLTVFQYLAYRNMTSTGVSYANIYQFLGSGEEGIGTICEDEADNIDLDSEKMKIYKNGYTTGRPTSKIDTSYGRKQLKFNNFCWKAFSAERLPDILKAQGFNQRIIEIFCTFGIPDYDISEVVNPAGDNEFQELLDELNDVRNTLLMYRLDHYTDLIPNISLNLVNREKQLFKPVIRVFQKTQTLNELLPVISKYVSDKRQKNTDSYHATLYNIVKDIVNTKGHELDSMVIVDYITEQLQCESIPARPQSFVSHEFGVLSVKGIINTLKEVFGAKKSPTHNKSRKLIFDVEKLAKLSKLYEIDIKVKVKEGDDKKDASDACTGCIDTYNNENEEETERENSLKTARNILLRTNKASYASYASLPLPSKCMYHSEVFGDIIYLESTENNSDGQIKCSECDHEAEPFNMKIHYQSTGHGEYKEPEIREVKGNSAAMAIQLEPSLNVSDFIKIQGIQDGDKTTFDTSPAIGELLLQNNFLTGHLRMRGREGGAYPYNYLEFIDNVFGAEPNTIEVCSRSIEAGFYQNEHKKAAFTVDINPECKPSLVADGQTLDGIKDNTFSRWRCDPPYNEKTAKEMYNCKLPSLSKLLAAGARIVKPGSLLFLLCSQQYQYNKNGLKRIGFVYISVVPNNETRILNIYVKLD